MQEKEIFSICTFYAISPIHAGSGAATSAVDLPIQRERHTNWPHIQASGVKGALRDHYRRFAGGEKGDLINLIFGSDKDNDGGKKGDQDDLPGAISISDAKLLAFPMRSNIAPFVWVTCPSVLKRLSSDLEFAGFAGLENVPSVEGEDAVVLNGEFKGDVILEDAVVKVNSTDNIKTNFALPRGFPEIERLLLVSDDIYDYCVSSCTEVQTQIKIDSGTGTALEGALRYEELLPADSVLYSIIYFSMSAGLNELQAKTIQTHIEDVIKGFIQIGGDETLGRGICRISWLRSNNGKGEEK